MNNLPIRLRLTVWYAVSLACLLALFGVLIQMSMSQRLLARTDDELREEMLELRLEVELAKSPAELSRQVQLRFGNHEMFQFQVTGEKGTLFLSPQLEGGIPDKVPPQTGASPQFETLQLPNGHRSRIVSQAVAGPQNKGVTLHVAMPLDRNLAELHELKLLLLLAGPVVMLVAVVGGYWLASVLLRPLNVMLHSASRITELHSQDRLEVINPHDEIGRLAQTLNLMLDRLQRSIDEQMQFTADAAHELRTPLAVIRSTAELALRQPRSAEYYQERLQMLVEEAEKLTHMSNQMLTLVKENVDPAQERQTSVNLSSLLESLVEELEPVCESQEISLRTHLDENLQVRGDEDRLRRVVMNILENSLKFTPANGSIDLSAIRSGNTVEVTIKDTGIGIPEDSLPHVFQRFYRVDASRNRETGGAGLGLAIVRTIVLAHGGEITISSPHSQGTEVRITLPLQVDQSMPKHAHFSLVPSEHEA